MIIHVVAPFDTIQSIAEVYGVSVDRLIQDNDLPNPENLVIGQTIVISYPKVTYTVKAGDTLASIANAFQVTPMQILQNNPALSDGNYLIEGEILIIEYDTEKIETISTNGYAYPFVDIKVLKKTLPYLTYLTIFHNIVQADGNLITVDDAEIVGIANDYGVAPIMLITTFTGSEEDGRESTRVFLQNPQSVQRLIETILPILHDRGYYGVNIDANLVMYEDRQRYVEFVSILSERLIMEGFYVFATITPNTFQNESGIAYRGPEYAEIGKSVHKILLISYEWGRTLRAPGEQLTLDQIREYIDYMKEEVAAEKLSIGIPCLAYDWELPFVRGISNTQVLNYNSAISLAAEKESIIIFNDEKQAPSFEYTTGDAEDTVQHVVWFKDARSIDSLVGLVPENGLDGIGIWNIMSYFAQFWLVVNNDYIINKVL